MSLDVPQCSSFLHVFACSKIFCIPTSVLHVSTEREEVFDKNWSVAASFSPLYHDRVAGELGMK
jgi:hypothetical protein